MPFPFKRIAKRLAEGDAARTAKGKGDALEDVVGWLFCTLPGIRVLKRNIVDNAGSTEVDLLLYNDPKRSPVQFLSEFPMIECKNWTDPVGSATVRDFVGKLREAKLKVGILVATHGVTGNANDRTAAIHVITRAFENDGITVLVITRDDIERFRTTEQVLELLQDRFGDAIMRSTTLR